MTRTRTLSAWDMVVLESGVEALLDSGKLNKESGDQLLAVLRSADIIKVTRKAAA